MASAPEGAFIIYAASLLVGAKRLTYGDRYDQAALGFDDMTDRTLKKVGQVLKLTRESYAKAIAHRAAGTVGAGFNPGELAIWGIIDPVTEQIEFPLGFEEYRGYIIATRKKGPAFNFEILSQRRESLRERNCRTLELARQFVDALPEIEVPADGVQLQPCLSDAA